MQTFDFSRSFIRFRVDLHAQPAITLTHRPPTSVNNVRIGIESCCELVDRETGATHRYLLGASCKTERVGPERDCWLLPNADFCLVVSNEEFLIIKSWACRQMKLEHDPEASTAPAERQVGCSRDAFQKFSLELQSARGQSLSNFDSIMAAIRRNRQLVSRTEYDDGRWHVTIDHPVKTINYSERENIFQTDTGPLLLPDLSSERLLHCQRLIECFDLAYSAFNSFDWAEFIVNVPTELSDGISVNHYSRPRRIEPVKNMLIEVLEDDHPAFSSAIGNQVPDVSYVNA